MGHFIVYNDLQLKPTPDIYFNSQQFSKNNIISVHQKQGPMFPGLHQMEGAESSLKEYLIWKLFS